MNKERIAELKAKFPELWQAKRLAGLSEETTAIVIQSQLDQDAANPPHLEVIRDSKRSIEMAIAAVGIAVTRLSQAKASRDATLALYPEAELPALPALGDSTGLDDLRAMLAKREQEVVNLGEEVTLKNERIAQLEAEVKDLLEQHLKLQGGIVQRANEGAEKDLQKIIDLEAELAEIKPRLTGLQLDHQTLLKERDALKSQLSEAAKPKSKK